MLTAFIDNRVFSLPPLFAEGDVMDETAAAMLNLIRFRRVRAKLRYLLERGEILVSDLQAKAEELAAQPLRVTATLDDSEEDDPILAEAMNIAREMINARMAEENLPPPKGIDTHAKALVDAMPELQEQARRRVEARYRAAQELMV